MQKRLIPNRCSSGDIMTHIPWLRASAHRADNLPTTVVSNGASALPKLPTSNPNTEDNTDAPTPGGIPYSRARRAIVASGVSTAVSAEALSDTAVLSPVVSSISGSSILGCGLPTSEDLETKPLKRWPIDFLRTAKLYGSSDTNSYPFAG